MATNRPTLIAVLFLAIMTLALAVPALAKKGGAPAHQAGMGDPDQVRGPGGPPQGMPPGQAKKMAAPPPWAPGPGSPVKRVYHYYPARGVYFDPGRSLWFWPDGGAWRFGAVLPVGLGVGGAFVALTMGVDMPYQFHPQVVQVYPPGYKVKGGPPPWAPAHGRRAKYMYRYYPGSRVYFDPGRGMWFWLQGDNWAFGASLPGGISARGSYVTLGMDADQPYQYHQDVIRYYPAR